MYSYKKPTSLKEKIKGTIINFENIFKKNDINYTSLFENYYNGICGTKINEEKSIHIKTYNFLNQKFSKLEIHLFPNDEICLKIFQGEQSFHSLKLEREKFKSVFKSFMRESEINNSDIFNLLSKHFKIFPEHKQELINTIKKDLKKSLSTLLPSKREHDLNSSKVKDDLENNILIIQQNIESLPLFEQKKNIEEQIKELNQQLNIINKKIHTQREEQENSLLTPLKSKQSIVNNLKSKIDKEFYTIFNKITNQLTEQEKIELMDYVNNELLAEKPKSRQRREI